MRGTRKADFRTWRDHPANPLIEPPRPEWMIADPTVVVPESSPEGRWHLFANSLLGIHHYVSDDGVAWTRRGGRLFPGLRPYVFVEEGYWLLYERFLSARRTAVVVRHSPDLERWGPPRTLLEPTFPWEGRWFRTNGNPCLVRRGKDYFLYYSAGTVFLWDCLYPEPRYVGLARARNLLGPYGKEPRPLLSPDPREPYRNLGAGAIKVVRVGGTWYGFNNGIYRDAEGRSRSAVLLLESGDGIRWRKVLPEPILSPAEGWKRAFVYALDVRKSAGTWHLYYNARDGWFRGSERIGLAQAIPSTAPRRSPG